jgi:hypothetical protein
MRAPTAPPHLRLQYPTACLTAGLTTRTRRRGAAVGAPPFRLWGSGILQFEGVVALAAFFLWWCFLCFLVVGVELSAVLLALALGLGDAAAAGGVALLALLAAMTGAAIAPAASAAMRIVLSFMSSISAIWWFNPHPG